MKIQEINDRECCGEKDLQECYAFRPLGLQNTISFCKYCGQYWYGAYETSPAGDTEYFLSKVDNNDLAKAIFDK